MAPLTIQWEPDVSSSASASIRKGKHEEKRKLSPAFSPLVHLLFCFPFILISMRTANVFAHLPSCVCCLIAEPPSPRPWDPPGSMYHLLYHLSPSVLLLLLFLPLLQLLSLLPSHVCVCLSVLPPSQCTAHTHGSTTTTTVDLHATCWLICKTPTTQQLTNCHHPRNKAVVTEKVSVVVVRDASSTLFGH